MDKEKKPLPLSYFGINIDQKNKFAEGENFNINLLHTFESNYKKKSFQILTVIKHFLNKGKKDNKRIFYEGICKKMKPDFTLFVDAGNEF